MAGGRTGHDRAIGLLAIAGSPGDGRGRECGHGRRRLRFRTECSPACSVDGHPRDPRSTDRPGQFRAGHERTQEIRTLSYANLEARSPRPHQLATLGRTAASASPLHEPRQRARGTSSPRTGEHPAQHTPRFPGDREGSPRSVRRAARRDPDQRDLSRPQRALRGWRARAHLQHHPDPSIDTTAGQLCLARPRSPTCPALCGRHHVATFGVAEFELGYDLLGSRLTASARRSHVRPALHTPGHAAQLGLDYDTLAPACAPSVHPRSSRDWAPGRARWAPGTRLRHAGRACGPRSYEVTTAAWEAVSPVAPDAGLRPLGSRPTRQVPVAATARESPRCRRSCARPYWFCTPGPQGRGARRTLRRAACFCGPAMRRWRTSCCAVRKYARPTPTIEKHDLEMAPCAVSRGRETCGDTARPGLPRGTARGLPSRSRCCSSRDPPRQR